MTRPPSLIGRSASMGLVGTSLVFMYQGLRLYLYTHQRVNTFFVICKFVTLLA